MLHMLGVLVILPLILVAFNSDLVELVRQLDQLVADVVLRTSLQLVVKVFILQGLGSVILNLVFSLVVLPSKSHVVFLKLSLAVR